MDIKLKTSRLLLQKLESGCGDSQLQAVAEIRLFSKWDDANRTSLANAGAIALLLQVLKDDVLARPRVHENAMAALLNMSINADVKTRIAAEAGGLDVIMALSNHGGSSDLRINAAALIYSLLIDDEARKIVCRNEMLGETIQGLLQNGSSRCKAEALKAMFVLAKEEHSRQNLLQEKLGLIGLLSSLLTVGKTKLTEDCLAVLALLAGCEAGAKALMGAPRTVPILVYLLNSGGSPRSQENAAAVLLNICQNDEGAKEVFPQETLLPALFRLQEGGSERGKGKAAALLMMLGVETSYSWLGFPTDSSVSMDHSRMKSDSGVYGKETSHSSVMPFVHTEVIRSNCPNPQHVCGNRGDDVVLSSPAPTLKPAFSEPSPSHKRFFPVKYIILAKKLFNTKDKKRTLNSVD